MNEKPYKIYELNQSSLDVFELLFRTREIDIEKPKKYSDSIIRLSLAYQDELQDHSNIWKSEALLRAYLLYYMPLNVLRTSAVLTEIFSFLPTSDELDIYDYGSGPGTSHLALVNNGIPFRRIYNFDCASEPLQVHQLWAPKKTSDKSEVTDDLKKWNSIKKNSLGIFNYSYNELKSLPPSIYNHDHLLLVEPSTQKAARRLQKLRGELLQKGYAAIAPCTHQQDCPLLKHSKKDWCHNRIFIDPPSWQKKLEPFLPMKNKTVTYSYLFLSKTIKPNTNKKMARIIGDTLFEKGKTRQAICRGQEREFLAWLKKKGKAPLIPRGTLYEISEDCEIKGNEIRPLFIKS